MGDANGLHLQANLTVYHPLLVDTSSYGITERASASSDAAFHAEQIRLVGFTIVKDVLTAAAAADVSARLDVLLQRQIQEAGGVEQLAGDQETVRCCLAYDDLFVRLASAPPVMDICRQLLGDYFLLMQQNGVVNPPARQHTQRAYHRDLPYQHFVSSRPIAISALFCAEPFTVENGGTIVLPGSHKVEEFPSDAAVGALQRSLEAPAGSFCMFDSMLFHRAGDNRSAHPRRGVNHVYTLPFVAQQISLPDALGDRYADDPELARLFGYSTTPAKSVTAWRERRRKRAPTS